jgi:glutamate racemase
MIVTVTGQSPTEIEYHTVDFAQRLLVNSSNAVIATANAISSNVYSANANTYSSANIVSVTITDSNTSVTLAITGGVIGTTYTISTQVALTDNVQVWEESFYLPIEFT